MGSQARMLTVMAVTVLMLSLGVASASASSALVRVETPNNISQFASLVDRTPVTVGVQPLIKAGRSCAADSAAAALSAAIGDDAWTAEDTGTSLGILGIKGANRPAVPLGGTAPAWRWVTFVDQHYVADPCTAPVPDGSEVLFFPGCTDRLKTGQGTCFTGGPLYLRINQGTPYQTKPDVVGGNGTPVSVWVIKNTYDDAGSTTIGPSTNSSVSTDEGKSATTNDPLRQGVATISFTNWGDHRIRATENGMVPARGAICTTDGQDGFCGTVKPDFNPFVTPPSPCDTNGHDGFCGTTDTSGPVAHVTNILNKQVYKKGKGPGKVKGTLDVDPNGVGGVKMRLTRVSTGRVRIKAKKSRKSKKKAKVRYRTVKRCTAWDDGTALLVTARCGTRYAKWFPGDLTDLRDGFDYSFAMTLPSGTYTLEVSATDEDGHVDAPAPGRNVVTFTVK